MLSAFNLLIFYTAKMFLTYLITKRFLQFSILYRESVNAYIALERRMFGLLISPREYLLEVIISNASARMRRWLDIAENKRHKVRFATKSNTISEIDVSDQPAHPHRTVSILNCSHK